MKAGDIGAWYKEQTLIKKKKVFQNCKTDMAIQKVLWEQTLCTKLGCIIAKEKLKPKWEKVRNTSDSTESKKGDIFAKN